MPVIKQYDNPITGLQPDERGVSARENAARGAGRSFNEAAAAYREVASATKALGEDTAAVGNQTARMTAAAIGGAGGVIVDYAEHQEKTHGAAADAALTDQLTKKWNDTVKNADPNDPTVAANFREQVLEPELQKFGQSFLTEGGQKFAELRVERLRNHMFEKTAADMGTLAAAAVGTNVRTIASARSNTALQDPSAVPHLLGSIDADVADVVGSSPNLRGVAATKARIELTEKVKDQVIKSGAVGAIQKSADPETEAARWIAKYPEYINGAEALQLARAARTQQQSARLDEERRIRLEDKARKEHSEDTREGYLKRIHSGDPQEIASVTAKGIVNDPNLTVQDKEHLIGIVKREFKPETDAKISSTTAMDLVDRIRAPEGDPRRITSLDPVYDEFIAGKLSKADLAFVRKEFTDLRTPEGARLSQAKEQFIKAVGPSIDKSNPLMGRIDQSGKINQYRLMVDLDVKMDEYRKAGKNPYDLINPSKPDFMGRPEALAPYQKTLQDSTRDTVSRFTNTNLTGPGKSVISTDTKNLPPPPPVQITPRKPGETPADYLKRTGGK